MEQGMQGGELYRMQQEAIRRARETAGRAVPRPSAGKEKPPLPEALTSDSALILAVFFLLAQDGCKDQLLLMSLLLLLIL